MNRSNVLLMTSTRRHPVRKTPDHSPHPRDGEDIIFITVNTEARLPILANEGAHLGLRDIWKDSKNWCVGRYVIMPDHVHLFARKAPGGSVGLDRWITWWKKGFLSALDLKPGSWQPSYWDTRMRSAEQYSAKWSYVLNNPVRRRLVSRSDEWAFQGEIYRLRA